MAGTSAEPAAGAKHPLPIVLLSAAVFLAASCAPAPQVGESAVTTAAAVGPQSTTTPSATSTPANETEASSTQFPMMEGTNGHRVDALYTVGNPVAGYLPVGVPDGIGAYELDSSTVRLLVSHELDADAGYVYELSNGTQLTGSRISFFDVDKATREVVAAGSAIDAVYDRSGTLVTEADQINEAGHESAGFSDFCSAQFVPPGGGFSFIDPIYFANEEIGNLRHPHGGTVWALDVQSRELWGLPDVGRGVWENVTPLDTGDPNTVALLLGEDRIPAPMYLWIGVLHPEATRPSDFVRRNGLQDGTLYAWIPDDPSVRTSNHFKGSGTIQSGTFTPIATRVPAQAAQPGHDSAGYRDADSLRDDAFTRGAFRFARPEDVATNPADGTITAFAVTGAYPDADDWGAVYVVDVDFTPAAGPTAVVTILHDSNDFGDAGIRNPDNLDWADNGLIYVQEDRVHADFGTVSDRDASIVELDPTSGAFTVIAEMVQSSRFPHRLGQWESSGVLDVAHLFDVADGEILLVASVQAHGLTSGDIAANQLVEGGQLIWVTRD